MSKAKRRVISAESDMEADLFAEQFQLLCQDVLERLPLRRGPFVFEDSDLRAMITAGSLVVKSRKPLEAE